MYHKPVKFTEEWCYVCVEILAESTSQADRVKYSILLDADNRSKKPVSP